MAAIDVRFKDHAIAGHQIDFVVGYIDDLAGNFMTDNSRIADQRVDALVGADVRTADPGAAYLDENFPDSTRGGGDIDQ